MVQKRKPPVKARPEDLDETLADPVNDKKARREAIAAKENGGSVHTRTLDPAVSSNGTGDPAADALPRSLEDRTVYQDDPSGGVPDLPAPARPAPTSVVRRQSEGGVIQEPGSQRPCSAEEFLSVVAHDVAEQIREYADTEALANKAGDYRDKVSEALLNAADRLEAVVFKHERCAGMVPMAASMIRGEGNRMVEATYILARWHQVRVQRHGLMTVPDLLGRKFPTAPACYAHRGLAIAFIKLCSRVAENFADFADMIHDPFWLAPYGAYQREMAGMEQRAEQRATQESQKAMAGLAGVEKELRSALSLLGEQGAAEEDSPATATPDDRRAFATYLRRQGVSRTATDEEIMNHWRTFRQTGGD